MGITGKRLSKYKIKGSSEIQEVNETRMAIDFKVPEKLEKNIHGLQNSTGHGIQYESKCTCISRVWKALSDIEVG